MARAKGGRQVAVVPHTEATLRLARKLAPRAKDAGIEIALVDERGQVIDIETETGRYRAEGESLRIVAAERLLRKRLEEMRRVDDVSQHPALLATLTRECPDAITLLDSVHQSGDIPA